MADDAGVVRIGRSGGVLTLSLNRPALGNVLSSDMVQALTGAFEASRIDHSVRGVLITAEGRHFCTGGNLHDFARLLDLPIAERRAVIAETMAAANAMILALAAIEVPVVIGCRGAVAGGGLSFLLAADMVLADDTAHLLFSHQRIGLPPDGGISALLPELVGSRKAAELVLNAATLDAEEALRLGFVSRVVEADALEDEAAAMATRLARGPAHAARAAKRLLRHGMFERLSEKLAAEREAIIEAVGEPDFEEGVRALLVGRPPQFPSAGYGSEI